MNCVHFPSWIAIVTAGFTVLLILIIVVFNRKWSTIKFFLFMNLNILVNDDDPENVDELEFDAFVAYR